MRTRIAAILSAAALMALGLPGVASASCTELIDDAGCVESYACAAAAKVLRNADCIE